MMMRPWMFEALLVLIFIVGCTVIYLKNGW